MEISNEAKKQIINSVLRDVAGISDKEYQMRVWIRGEGTQIDSFDDTCCDFFGDGDPLLNNYKDFGLTEAQYAILKTFRDAFDEFIRKKYWPEFIDTPGWARIMEMAKDVLKAFDYKKPW